MLIVPGAGVSQYCATYLLRFKQVKESEFAEGQEGELEILHLVS